MSEQEAGAQARRDRRRPSRRRPSRATSGPCRSGTSPISIPAPTPRPCKRDLEKAAEEAQRIKQRYQGKLAALAGDGAALAEAIAAYESLSDTIGKLGSYAGLLYAGRHVQSRERQVLRRHPGEDHRHHDRPDLLRAGAQQDRRGDAGARAARCRRSRATSRGSTTCARRSPTSSRSSSSACSTRSRSPRTAPGAGSSARR